MTASRLQYKFQKEKADLMQAALLEVVAFFEDPTAQKEDVKGTQELVQRIVDHYICGATSDISDIKELILGKDE